MEQAPRHRATNVNRVNRRCEEHLQCGFDCRSRRVLTVRTSGQQRLDNVNESSWQIGPRLSERHPLAGCVRAFDGRKGAPTHGIVGRDKEVEQDADAVQIGPDARGFMPKDLGGQVQRRAGDLGLGYAGVLVELDPGPRSPSTMRPVEWRKMFWALHRFRVPERRSLNIRQLRQLQKGSSHGHARRVWGWPPHSGGELFIT